MNWINAYINAVKTNLPREKREDVGEELRGLLEEEFESEVGKTPGQASEEEALAWLKPREHPHLVAARYHKRRVLIDEESYPLFTLTLRYTLFGLAVAHAIAAFAPYLSQPADYGVSLADQLGYFIRSCLIGFAGVVLFFHYFGKRLKAADRLAQWNPRELPDPDRKWEQEPWSSSIAGLVFTGIFLLFLNGFLTDLAEGLTDGRPTALRFQFVEEATALLPWINAVLIASLVLYGVMLIRPYWSLATLGAHALIALAAAWILYQLQDLYPYLSLEGGTPQEADNLDRLQSWLNTSLRIAIVIALLVNLFEAGRDFWRMSRVGRRRPI